MGAFYERKPPKSASLPRSKSASALDLKSVFTARANDVVLSLSLRQSQNCLTGSTFAVDVSFSISEFAFS